MPWPTSVLVNVQDMAKLMISSDLAIGAAGSSSWERCCMGLPTITLVLADNQLRVGLALSQAGCALLLQTSFPTLAEMQAAIQHFSDSTILSSTSQVCANLVDGMGIDRIVDAVLEFKHEAGNVRPMTSDDLDLVFQWRNHPKIRHEMLTQHEIVFEEHRVWFNRVSADPRKCVLIYEENGIRKGFVQFTNAQAGEVSDWGFYTAPDATKGTGQKLGNAALDYAFEKLKLHKVCGQAIASNKASIKFHLKLGFTQEGILREQVHGMLDYQDLICFGILEREWKAK
jgi:UDP-4-amino-4,6-dideoxy-N-acetyl-beta-L-altrosamine N-acetyltransferase